MGYRLREADPAAAAELGRAAGVSATLAQLLLHRGLSSVAEMRAFLTPALAGMSSPESMAARTVAAARIARAVDNAERIVVFGDYDVDGTTSAAILTEGLRKLGGQVQPLLANRFDGGYGFSAAALARVVAAEPGLVVTCDCGSSDHPRLSELRNRGIDSVVVDHHLVPSEPLPTLAFLNPHRPDCGFEFKALCSAGLALSLIAAVRTTLGRPLDLRPFLDLAALGTIADVVPLQGDNRRLVRAGLSRLSSDQARPGVRALRKLAKVRQGTNLGAIDVAFRLTPRLNAPGRLGDQELSLALLLAETDAEAERLAAKVDGLNEERRRIERAVTAEAIEQVLENFGPTPQTGVVVGSRDFHPGVVGISAARLVDRFQVPAVVVALDEPHGHGSARGPANFPLFDAITACEQHLVRFGGHQAASGVTLVPEALGEFRAAFAMVTSELARTTSPTTQVVDVTLGDGPFFALSASELAMLEPMGEGNAEPLFWVPRAVVLEAREVGQGHLKLRLRIGREALSAFGFELASQGIPGVGETVQLIGHLRPDHYRGDNAVEVRVLELRRDLASPLARTEA